ncbi:GNAT family N-acetyltransferase [Bartonella sp. LJL80]
MQEHLTLQIGGGAADIDPAHWNFTGTVAGKPDYNPFVSRNFLTALELSGSVGERTGWLPQYLRLVDQSNRIVGLAPAYLKSHSQGEYVFDQGWADAYDRAGGHYYPKLQVAVPFTPVPGPRLLTLAQDNQNNIQKMLAEGLKEIAILNGLSSVHSTFIKPNDVEVFKQQNYLIRSDRQYYFYNDGYCDFDDFLQTLPSRRRKVIKRERRAAVESGITIEWLTGSDLTEAVWDDFFVFYQNTGARKWGSPYLTRAFYSIVGKSMAGDIVLMIAKRDGRRIAGAINFKGTDHLYGRHWGAIEDHPFLHFELCYYQAIEYAIENKIRIVEAGAQGEHKIQRGYIPTETNSAHYIDNIHLRDAVARFLQEEQQALALYDEDVLELLPFKR